MKFWCHCFLDEKWSVTPCLTSLGVPDKATVQFQELWGSELNLKLYSAWLFAMIVVSPYNWQTSWVVFTCVVGTYLKICIIHVALTKAALRNSLVSTHCKSYRDKQEIKWERLSHYCVTLLQFTTKVKKMCTNVYTEQENVKIVSQFYNNFIQKNGVGRKQYLQNRLKTNKQWLSVILMKAVQWWEVF